MATWEAESHNACLITDTALVAYDMDIAKAEAVAAERGIAAKNILELARTADVILSCLTNDEAVQSVYAGPAGVFAEARPGTVVLEMSTISPETSRELHRLGAKSGIEVLDVAISGSTPAAEQGTVTLLAGGNQDLFDAARANIPGDCKAILSSGRSWLRNSDEVGSQHAVRCWHAGHR